MFGCLMKKWNKRGSFLIEALLSVAILSVSLTLIIQSMTDSLRAMHQSTDYTAAVFLLDNQMVGLIQKGFVGADIEETGNFESPFEEYEYDLRTKSLADETLKDLNEVHLRIRWGTENKRKSMDLVSYLFNEPEEQ